MTRMSHEDPIVAEVHATREKLLKQYGGAEGYATHLREMEAQLKDRVVAREPRRPTRVGRKLS
jgi:hypothetical protein